MSPARSNAHPDGDPVSVCLRPTANRPTRTMLAAASLSMGFAARWTPARSSRAFSASRVRCALDSEVEKSLYALGQKIGVQLGDLKCFTAKELDNVFLGMKDNVINAPSQVSLDLPAAPDERKPSSRPFRASLAPPVRRSRFAGRPGRVRGEGCQPLHEQAGGGCS